MRAESPPHLVGRSLSRLVVVGTLGYGWVCARLAGFLWTFCGFCCRLWTGFLAVVVPFGLLGCRRSVAAVCGRYRRLLPCFWVRKPPSVS